MSRRRTSWRQHGVTLIEVMAALALLGSLAVAMVLSRGWLVEQHQQAGQKLEAVEVADKLLAQWWAGETIQLPIDATGRVDGYPVWSWQTRVVDNRSLASFEALVVRLSILDDSVVGQPVELTTVDLVMPRKAEAGQP